MQKLKCALPLLFLALFLFTGCVESIQRPIHQDTIAPEFSVEDEALKKRISAIVPAENIYFTSTKTKKSGEDEYNTLNVEIVAESLPSNGFSFHRISDEIKEAVASGIGNLEDYQKMKIEVRRTVIENGTEHNRSYKKEIDL